MANFGKKKIVWRIDFSKKSNIVRFVFFCFFGVQIIGLLIWALIYQIKGIWTSNNAFLIAFPILLILINLLIGRNIIKNSQPED